MNKQKYLLNKRGFGLVETIVSMAVIAIVSFVTLDSINRVRINEAKTESYLQARTFATNAYEFFIFSVDTDISTDDYSFVKMLDRNNLQTDEYKAYIESEDKTVEFSYTPDSKGYYTFNYTTDYYHMIITVNYSINDVNSRPSFDCVCYNKVESELFHLSYLKGIYDNVTE